MLGGVGVKAVSAPTARAPARNLLSPCARSPHPGTPASDFPALPVFCPRPEQHLAFFCFLPLYRGSLPKFPARRRSRGAKPSPLARNFGDIARVGGQHHAEGQLPSAEVSPHTAGGMMRRGFLFFPLRLGHAAALTAHGAVIHYRPAAALPYASFGRLAENSSTKNGSPLPFLPPLCYHRGKKKGGLCNG